MASSSTSSSSSKNGLSVPANNGAEQTTKPVLKEKSRSIVDSYRYLATGFARQHVSKMGKSKAHQMSDSNVVCFSRLTENHYEKKENRSETNTDIKTMKNLAKEMGKMLTNAKSKGHTSELLQLFKNTLNNFVVDKNQVVTSSGEGSGLNQKKLLKKRPIKPRPAAEQDHEKNARASLSSPLSCPPVPSSSPSVLKYNNRSLKNLGSNKLTLSADKEGSYITATALMRTKLRDPMKNLIESSKTKMLHRCNGKQNVKALPLHMGGKKSSAINVNCQQLVGTKVKTVAKSIKMQQISVNQQMKTIYENEKFDKSRSVSKSPVTTERVTPGDSTKTLVSLSEIGIGNQELSALETYEQQQNFDISTNKSSDLSLAQKNLIPPVRKNSSDSDSNEALERHTLEQDNSLVQRLTSFWNKKLNVNGNEKAAGSDASLSSSSSVTSSTTYIVKSNSENDVSEDDISKFHSFECIPNSGAKENSISTGAKNNSSQQVNGNRDKIIVDKETEKESELPEIKMGLMDELISVLKKKSNPSSSVKAKDNDDNKKATVINNNDSRICRNKQNNEGMIKSGKVHKTALKKDFINNLIHTMSSNDNLSNISSDGYEACLDEEYSNDETSVANDVVRYDDDDESNNTDDDYKEECDEETIEAIQTCLMRRITVRNCKTKNYEEDLLDEEYQAERSHTLTYDDSFKEYQSNSSEKDQVQITRDSKDTDSFKDDNDPYIEEKNNEMKDNDEYIDAIGKEAQTNDEAPVLNRSCSINSQYIDNKDKITNTIMNVNDIIKNLRKLICTIETIPDELKVINMDLNSLPIPKEVKQTLSFIVDSSLTNDQSDLGMLTERLKKSFNNSQLMSYPGKNCRNKIIECKREGTLYICRFPSTFTMPTIETVINPIELIYFPTRNEYITSKINLIRLQNRYSFSEINGMILNEGIRVDHQPENDETSSYSARCDDKCVTKIMPKSQSPYYTVFYGSVGQNKVMPMKAIPSAMFHPRKKIITPSNTDSTTEVHKEVKFYVEKETFRTGGHLSTNLDNNDLSGNKNANISPKSAGKGDTNEYNDANENCNPSVPENVISSVCFQENGINFGDNNVSGEFNFSKHQNCNNTGRSRRLWRQTNQDEDIAVLTGGAGDYSGVISPFPCHRTSSMSVIVSSSVNDSNSQTDIHLLENECRVRSPTIHANAITRCQAEADNLSCNVIHEISEESASDIDDCVMIAAHQKQETKTNDLLVLPSPLFESLHEDTNSIDGMMNEKKHLKNCNVTEDKNVLDKYNGKNCLLLDQTTSITGLHVDKKPLVGNIGTLIDSSITNSICDGYSETINNGVNTKKSYNRDYVLMCCNAAVPKIMQRIFEQKTVNLTTELQNCQQNYNLDMVLKDNPDLKKELSNAIDINNLCDKEKQLIAVCFVLLRENNSSVIDKSKPLFKILVENLGERANILWHMTLGKINEKMLKAKKRLRLKCQTHTEFLINCQYKQLIKIIYTTLVSLVLCFVIQKNFCGISLPITFPW